jgi:asparagine synthase (glutamine-hydrolysing)
LTRDKAPAWMDHSVINPGFAGRIGLQQRYQSVEVGRFRAARTFRENQLQSFEAGLLQTALESLDKVTAAFQLEARYPFFDRRLMVFCLALPPSQRLASGWTRLIQRRAMEGILPPGIQWRTSKANLSPNLLHGLLEFNKPNIDQLLSANPQKIEPYLDLARLQEVCRTYLSQPHTSQKEALALFGAIILANWLRDSAISA